MRPMEQAIVNRFDGVIEKGKRFIEFDEDRPPGSKPDIGFFTEWETQSATLLNSVFEQSHTYRVRFEDDLRGYGPYVTKVRKGLGILAAAREDYAKGHIWTLEEKVHADLFEDYLEMAGAIIEGTFKDAAAVIAGSTLESHLRALSTKKGIQTVDAKGKPEKSAKLNDVLKKHGTFNNNDWRQVATWLDIRNDAAHGEYEKYDIPKVKRMVDGIRVLMTQHPA